MFHVLRLLVAGEAEEDEAEAGPDDESDGEDIVLVEGRVKLHVVELQGDDQVYIRVSGVGGEGRDAELDYSHRRNQHEDDVKEETVHPGFVFLHGMEAAAAGNAHSELHCSLLHAPDQVQAKVGEDTSGQEPSVAVIKRYEKFVEEGDQRPVEAFCDIAENTE